MKKNEFTLLTLACCLSLLTACSPDDARLNQLSDLNSAVGVASNTMNSLDKSNANADGSITKDTVMDAFSKQYASDLNNEKSLTHLGPMGVNAQADGSFATFADTNNNQIKDEGEKELFKVEADAENNRLVASNENGVTEQPHSFMGSGFLMGMLMGNMLSRQRATGANPASRKATPRRSSGFGKSTPSARSRAGSGSHASGK